MAINLPAVATVNLPGRILTRVGFESQISAAGLRLGELAYTTDGKKLYVGNESSTPPWIPTTGYVGALDWGNIDLTTKSITVTNINGKPFAEFVSTTIINTGQVLTVVKEAITKTVYGAGADFVDLPAAFEWLSQRTISNIASVTLNLPAGVVVENRRLTLRHPNGERIFIRGKPLKTALPDPLTLQAVNNTTSQIITDTAVNLTRLRTSYATEIAFSGGGGIDFRSNIAIFSNVLCTFDGTKQAGADYSDGLGFSSAFVTLENIAVVGAQFRGISVGNSSNVSIVGYGYCFGNLNYGAIVGAASSLNFTNAKFYVSQNGITSGSSGQGVVITSSGLFAALPFNGAADTTSQLVCVCNTGVGIAMSSGSCSLANNARIVNNGPQAVTATAKSDLTMNLATISGSAYGVSLDYVSVATVSNSSVSATNTGLTAGHGSYINAPGTTPTAPTPYFPGLNTTGNNNSQITS